MHSVEIAEIDIYLLRPVGGFTCDPPVLIEPELSVKSLDALLVHARQLLSEPDSTSIWMLEYAKLVRRLREAPELRLRRVSSAPRIANS